MREVGTSPGIACGLVPLERDGVGNMARVLVGLLGTGDFERVLQRLDDD
ncbi:hypothetical protein ACFY94_04165 [Streptomyces griseorubiginosus]